MPLVIGVLALTFIALALLTLITLYWLLTQWHNFAQQIPVVGRALANIGDYVRDRNGEIITFVISVAHNVISWSIDRIMDGFKLLHDLYNLALQFNVIELVNRVTGLSAFVNGVIVGQIATLQQTFKVLNGFVHGFVALNIDALNFWKAATTVTLNTFLIPNVNALIRQVDRITGLTIPTIQVRLGAAERTIQVTLPAEIAEAKTDIGAVQRELARTTTAPRTGLLDRVTGLEGGLAQVLPWAAAIGLSIPIARTLGRVGRNPCTCLEESGQTDMLPLLMFLFVDAD